MALIRSRADHRAGAHAGATLAGVGSRTGVAVIARGPGLGRHRAGRGAVAGPGVARVAGAGDRGAAAYSARRAHVVVGACVAVIAGGAAVGRDRTGRGTIAGSGVARVAGAGDGRPAAYSARRAFVVVARGSAVIAGAAGV